MQQAYFTLTGLQAHDVDGFAAGCVAVSFQAWQVVGFFYLYITALLARTALVLAHPSQIVQVRLDIVGVIVTLYQGDLAQLIGLAPHQRPAALQSVEVTVAIKCCSERPAGS
ncbi:MAG: hypothetical protein ACRERW_01630 [Pseudomonas sp.]